MNGSFAATVLSESAPVVLCADGELCSVSMTDVILDRRFAVRDRLDEETVQRYVECFDDLPPPVGYERPEGILLVAGWHRMEAGRRLGRTEIWMEVRQGSDEEALEFALLDNLRRGLQLTRRERRRVVAEWLKLHPERSNQWIAEDLGTTRETVGKVREELEAGCEIRTLEVLMGRDGKKYPRTIKQPKRELAEVDAGTVRRGTEATSQSRNWVRLGKDEKERLRQIAEGDGDDGEGVWPATEALSQVEGLEDAHRVDQGIHLDPRTPLAVAYEAVCAGRPISEERVSAYYEVYPQRCVLSQANAIQLPLGDGSVHMAAFSPPYWGMRHYKGDQGIAWPPVEYAMPGGVVRIPGDPECVHEWEEGHSSCGRGPQGKKSTLTGGKATQEASRYDSIPVATCRRCGAWWGPLRQEPTPEMFVGHIILILQDVWRVLRDDGVCWLNLGFSYQQTGKWGGQLWQSLAGEGNDKGLPWRKPSSNRHPVYKATDCVPIPWLVGIAAQHDGWYLRSPVVWAKPNCLPQSMCSRLTLDYEHVLLLTKNRQYYYDTDGVREALRDTTIARQQRRERLIDRVGVGALGKQEAELQQNDAAEAEHGFTGIAKGRSGINLAGRNKRTNWNLLTEATRLTTALHTQGWDLEEALCFALGVDGNSSENLWWVSVSGWKGKHFATWPPALVAPMIMAGSSPAVCARCGTPWERIVEKGEAEFYDRTRSSPVYDAASGHTRGQGPATLRTVKTQVTLGWQPVCHCFDHDFEPEGCDSEYAHGPCLKCGENHIRPAIVLDCCIGTGTTAQVAMMLGRSAVGFDLSFEYLRHQARERVAMQE